jgi:creatinine amidohydrolase
VPYFSELLPDQLDALWSEDAPAVVAWGALEWHGAHLPLGLDGIVASWFAQRLVDRTNGVLLPGIWLPMTTLPHRHSLQIRTETFRMVLDELISGLYQSGARRVCLITGHYAQGHQVEMSEAALRAMDDHEGLQVFSGAPLELLADFDLLDHAAHFETSQLLAIRPDLVHLEHIEEGASSHESAVIGDRPSRGNALEGEALLEAGLNAWLAWIQDGSIERLEAHHKGVFDRYADYMDKYYQGSWEDAIQAWWAEKGDA